MNKKAFTLIELVVTILLTAIIMELSYTYYKTSKWYSAVNKMEKEIFTINDNGVMNTTTGYINATGGDCSNTNEYTDISAARVVDCADYNNTFPYGGIKSTDGTQSYITAFLENYTDSAAGCKLYYDDKSTTEYYMFLDCSNINYDGGSARAKKYLEQKTSSYMRENFSTIYQSTDFDSTAVSNDTGGSDSDGMLRILFKK